MPGLCTLTLLPAVDHRDEERKDYLHKLHPCPAPELKKKHALLNIKSKLKAMILTILWSTYRKHRHFHDETKKYFSAFENTFVESDQLKILQAHVNGKNITHVTLHQNSVYATRAVRLVGKFKRLKKSGLFSCIFFDLCGY